MSRMIVFLLFFQSMLLEFLNVSTHKMSFFVLRIDTGHWDVNGRACLMYLRTSCLL